MKPSNKSSEIKVTESLRQEGASQANRILRWILPFLVSAILLVWLLSSMNVSAVLEHFTPDVASLFIPTLLVFLIISLSIEAISLVWVVSQYHSFSSRFMAARMKAASYLLGLINYALGAGAVALLLHRRSGIPLPQAAGSVIVISLFDLGSLLLLSLFALGMREAEESVLNSSFIILATLLIFAGFGLLRASFSLGPLDRLRDLKIFEAARTLPIPLLIRLGVLRVIFVASFILFTAGTLYAFGVSIPIWPMTMGVCVLLMISAIPMAAAGLGTGQIAFIAIFEKYAEPEILLAASLTMSFGLILSRAALGLIFAREFTSEAFEARAEIAK